MFGIGIMYSCKEESDNEKRNSTLTSEWKLSQTTEKSKLYKQSNSNINRIQKNINKKSREYLIRLRRRKVRRVCGDGAGADVESNHTQRNRE
jgi:hypothetical protein